MAYYAPFYRPTYYDPVQQPMGQFNQQFQQPTNQFPNQQPVRQNNGGFVWIQGGEAGAKSKPSFLSEISRRKRHANAIAHI